jgi:hypothetical protein
MNDEQDKAARDESWAKPIEELEVPGLSDEALNLNVEGRRLAGALQGFGKMWQKTYRVEVGASATPENVIAAWKKNYSSFWPPGDRLYAPFTTLNTGDVAVINSTQGGVTLSTGVMVVYADDQSFTFMTPQGHPFAGWITFSAFEEHGGTAAQIELLMRTGDPIYEAAFMTFAGKREDKMWQHTLRSVAAHFGSEEPVSQDVVCVDPKRQWSQTKNIRHNAAIRSGVYALGSPFRGVRNLLRRKA